MCEIENLWKIVITKILITIAKKISIQILAISSCFYNKLFDLDLFINWIQISTDESWFTISEWIIIKMKHREKIKLEIYHYSNANFSKSLKAICLHA